MTLRTPFRPLIFLAVTATAALTLIQVEATSVLDVSVLPVPAHEVAAVPPSSTSDDTPRETAPAADTVGRTPTAEAAPTPSSAAIEGLDPFEVYLRLTGILTTTLVTDDKAPVATEQAPITTAQAPVVTVEAPMVTAAQPVPPAAAPAAIVAPQPAPPKPAAAATTPVTRPTTSPGAQTTPTTGPLLPSVFEQAQIVSFYGYPGIGVMGELGLHTPRARPRPSHASPRSTTRSTARAR